VNHGVVGDCTILALAYLIFEGEGGASQTMGSLVNTKKMYVEENLNI
jgi:hypothetical protein